VPLIESANGSRWVARLAALGLTCPTSHICTMARAWLRTVQVEPNAGSGISTPIAQAATSRPKASSAIPTACPRAQPPYGVAIEPSAGGDFAGDLAEHCVGHPPPERNQPLIVGIGAIPDASVGRTDLLLDGIAGGGIAGERPEQGPTTRASSHHHQDHQQRSDHPGKPSGDPADPLSGCLAVSGDPSGLWSQRTKGPERPSPTALRLHRVCSAV
jgi:hypothetical protein